MKKEIKQRIDDIRNGKLPNGYLYQKNIYPSEWKIVLLKPFLIPHIELSNAVESYNVMTSSRNGLLNYSDYFNTNCTGSNKVGYHLVPPNAITYRLMSDDATFHFNMNMSKAPILVSPEYPVFFVKNSNTYFILSYLNESQLFKDFCISQRKGSTRTRLYYNVLETFCFPLPPLPEQQAIAEVLSTCDRVLSLKRELLSELQKRKKWLMQKLLDPNSGVRLPGFKGKWEQKKLGEISDNNGQYGLNAPACKFAHNLPKYIRITDIDEQGRYLHENMACVNVKDYSDYTLTTGDILFARTGASTGKSYLYKEKDGILVFAGFLIRFHIKTEYYSSQYCFYYTQTKEYEKFVKKMSARSGQPGINAEEFSSLKILLPSLPEQTAIANVLSTADREIELVEEEIQSWELKKKSLMQLLLTGIVRTV